VLVSFLVFREEIVLEMDIYWPAILKKMARVSGPVCYANCWFAYFDFSAGFFLLAGLGSSESSESAMLDVQTSALRRYRCGGVEVGSNFWHHV